MFDALYDTLDRLQDVKGKKSILLLATGFDTFSKHSLDQTYKRLEQSDVTIFTIGVAETLLRTSMGEPVEYLQAKNQLNSFADYTGGYAWFPRFDGELPDIFHSVATAFLRNQYTLAYSPSNAPHDGKFHKIKVEILDNDGQPFMVANKKGKKQKVVVYARRGYLAPKGGIEGLDRASFIFSNPVLRKFNTLRFTWFTSSRPLNHRSRFSINNSVSRSHRASLTALICGVRNTFSASIAGCRREAALVPSHPMPRRQSPYFRALRQRRFIHQRAARHVNEVCGTLHARKLRRAHHPASLRRFRGGQDDVSRPAAKRRPGRSQARFSQQAMNLPGPMGDCPDVHAQGFRQLGHLAAHRAESHEQQHRAGQLRGCWGLSQISCWTHFVCSCARIACGKRLAIAIIMPRVCSAMRAGGCRAHW